MVNDEVFRFFAGVSSARRTSTRRTPLMGVAASWPFPVSSLSILRGDFSWNAITIFAGNEADQCTADGAAKFTL